MKVLTCSPLAFAQGCTLPYHSILNLLHARLKWEQCFREGCRIGPIMAAETSVFTFHRGRLGV